MPGLYLVLLVFVGVEASALPGFTVTNDVSGE